LRFGLVSATARAADVEPGRVGDEAPERVDGAAVRRLRVTEDPASASALSAAFAPGRV